MFSLALSANSPLILKMENQSFSAGEEVDVQVFASNFENILGYQYAFAFDVQFLEYIAIGKGDLQGVSEFAFGLKQVKQGKIRHSWISPGGQPTSIDNNLPMYTLRFKVKKDIEKLGRVISLDEPAMVSEAITADMKQEKVILEFFERTVTTTGNAVAEKPSLGLLANTPNPFTKSTFISFTLPVAGNANIDILNNSGKVVQSFTSDFVAGVNTIRFDADASLESGFYFYRLTFADQEITKKMVLVK